MSALKDELAPELGRAAVVGLIAIGGSWLVLNSRGLLTLGGLGRRRPVATSAAASVQLEQVDVPDVAPQEAAQEANTAQVRSKQVEPPTTVGQDASVHEHEATPAGTDEAGTVQGAVSVADRSVLSRVRLMGANLVEGPDRVSHARSVDLRALLGLLAENRRTLVTRQHAEERLWPEDVRISQDRFPNLLKDARARLCDVLGKPSGHGKFVIQNISNNGYRLNPELFTCDVWELRDLLASAAAAGPDEKAGKLGEAVKLYVGPYLSGLTHDWAQAASHGVAKEVIRALSQLAAAEADPERAVSHLEKATSIVNTAEHLYRSRMQLYADLDRATDVHHCFDELTDVLKARAAKPERQTVELYRRLTAAR